MTKVLKIITIVVIFAAFSIPSLASEGEEYLDRFSEILPEGYEGLADGGEELTDAVGFDAVLSEIGAALSDRRGEIAAFFLLLLGSAVLVSLASVFEGPLAKYTAAGVGAICSVTVFMRLYSVFYETVGALEKMSAFFSAAVPIVLAVTAASGGAATAAVGGVGMSVTLSILGGVGGAVFGAVAGFSFALALFSSLGGEGLASVSRGVRSFFTWALGIVTAILAGTLALQTVIASARDSIAMRTARYMATGIIPVVGGVVSGSLGTLLSGLSYVKSIIGVGAVAVIVSTAIAPLLTLLLYRLALSSSVVLLDFMGVGGGREPFVSFRSALDSLIVGYSLSALIYIYELILFVRGGASL